MRTLAFFLMCSLGLLTSSAFAQKGEIGVAVGGSFYRNQTLRNGTLAADAGFGNGVAFSVYGAQNSGGLVSGELRYTYERNDLNLSGNSRSAGFAGDSHAVHYDVLIHLTPRGSRIRPFGLVGGGIKYYRGTGSEALTQVLSNVALLTKDNDLKGLFTFGGGVKFQATEHFQLRLDVRDYLTSFPKKVITPNAGTTGGGFLHNVVPAVGVAYTF